MTFVPQELAPSAAGQLFRGRCQQLGLPAWRIDVDARLVVPPTVAGLAGRWLAAPDMTDRIRRAVRSATASGGERETIEIFPHARLIVIAEVERRQVAGFTAVLALSPAALAAPAFAQLSLSAGIDPSLALVAMEPLARTPEHAVGPLARSLRLMAGDLARLAESDETIAGFTRQLTDGFETIDLLYTLGRSMNDLGKPGQFLDLVVGRLHESMPFGWLAASFVADARAADLVGTPLFLRGAGVAEEELLRSAREVAARLAAAPRSEIFTDLRLGGPETRQVLAQPIFRAGRLLGLLLCGEKRGEDTQVSSYDIHLLEAAAGYVGAFLDNAILYADQQAMFLGMVRSMTAAIDAKDRYTRGHSERVAHMARMLSLRAGLGEAFAERVHIAGLVHDVGKIGVPEAVLGKRGKLTDEEFAQIKLHPEIGHRILRDIPLLDDILPGVLHHHERWDGRGYPHMIGGESIPLSARVLAVADTFDAMSSTRSYRSAMPREKVLEEIRRCAGGQFDPALAEQFVVLDFSDYDEMVARHGAAEAAMLLDEGLRAAA